MENMGKSEVNTKKKNNHCFLNFRKGAEMNFHSSRVSEGWRRRRLGRKGREEMNFVLF